MEKKRHDNNVNFLNTALYRNKIFKCNLADRIYREASNLFSSMALIYG